MKSKYISYVVSLIILVMLIGCSGVNEPVFDEREIKEVSRDDGVSGGIGRVDDVIQNSQISEVSEDSKFEVLGSENQELIKEYVNVADQVKVFPRTKTLKINDKYMYVLAITNTLNQEFVGKIKVEFKEAVTRGIANRLDANEKVMLSWLDRSDYGELKVSPNSISYMPLIVNIKDEMAKDLETKPGSYTFEVIVYDNSTMYRTNTNEHKVYNRAEFTLVIS